jgi:hypothetical protein
MEAIMSTTKKVLRYKKFKCDDGSTWCTIWYSVETDPETGHCFDFRFEDIAAEYVELARERIGRAQLQPPLIRRD